MEDNTPVLASMAVAVNNAQLQKRKRAEKFVEMMLDEEVGQGAMDAVNPEYSSGKTRETDIAVFYYPGLDDGIIVNGPHNSVKDMLSQFFQQNLPSIMPEASEFRNVPVKQLAQKALDSGMVVLFGAQGVLNSVMAKRPHIRLADGGSAAEDAFDSAESSIVYMPSYGSISSTQYPIGDLLPQLKWLASAQ
jgi:hypothetical protein